MKNLLNSIIGSNKPLWESKTASQVETITVSHIEKQNAIVQEIHDTFYSEVDRLLVEAGIKVSTDTDKQALIDKASRLRSLGFGSTKESSEASVEELRISTAGAENQKKQDLIEAINYFSFKYPQYKFITEDSVKKICQKYGLIYGEVSKYKGEVPNKNLEDIERFSVKEEDFVFSQVQFRSKEIFDYKLQCDYVACFNEYESIPVYDKRFNPLSHFDILHIYRGRIGTPAPLEIAAPIKDFDTSRMEIKDFKLVDIEIPDPVVLHPVMFKGVKHYLIVTAWGLEASDELVVNQRNN